MRGGRFIEEIIEKVTDKIIEIGNTELTSTRVQQKGFDKIAAAKCQVSIYSSTSPSDEKIEDVLFMQIQILNLYSPNPSCFASL
jgi:hypothetical protein